MWFSLRQIIIQPNNIRLVNDLAFLLTPRLYHPTLSQPDLVLFLTEILKKNQTKPNQKAIKAHNRHEKSSSLKFALVTLMWASFCLLVLSVLFKTPFTCPGDQADLESGSACRCLPVRGLKVCALTRLLKLQFAWETFAQPGCIKQVIKSHIYWW